MSKYDVPGAMRILVRRWDKEGTTYLPPETRESVEAAFASVGARATTDIIQLYSVIGGLESMDGAYLAIWPLKQFREENAEPSEYGPLFADYLICSWCYRLKPRNEHESEIHADLFDGEMRRIAPTLAELLSDYVDNPEAPHGW